MGPFDPLVQHLGLVSLGVLAVALTVYLAYSMIHPEWF